MDVTDEWRIFDPQDKRTHPEGISRVEIEFQDGRTVSGQYSRDAGMFTMIGNNQPQSTDVKRWRYTSRSPDPM